MSLFLKETRVILELAVADKNGVLSQLAEVLAADMTGVRSKRVLEILWEREKLGSTGIGQGIAIPHGRVPGLSVPMAALARSRNGVEFMALDGQPVHLVMALLLPTEASEAHLQILADMFRLLRQPNSRRRLMLAMDRESLYQAAVLDQDGL
ncbi:MAG: PTS sugar transporter subunit IIA [Magnetococcales bacterium]|nr:PTS sugar transporter subunit IIA [Magnetococcales bacterium]